MSNTKLQSFTNCPHCGRLIRLTDGVGEVQFGDRKIDYKEVYYYCPHCVEKFVNDEIDDINKESLKTAFWSELANEKTIKLAEEKEQEKAHKEKVSGRVIIAIFIVIQVALIVYLVLHPNNGSDSFQKIVSIFSQLEK